MGFNKTGLGSLVAGVIILFATWHLAFFKAGAVSLAQSLTELVVNGLVVGGLTWLGVLLTVLGVLILVI